MDLFLKLDLEALLQPRQAPCVSIYLPTHRSGPGAEQDSLRAKRMLRWAQDRLEAGGLGTEAAKRLLRPLRRQFSSSRFFREPGDGLAAFCSADYCRTFLLPLEVPERLEVGERFYVKPLLPLVGEPAADPETPARKRPPRALTAKRFAELARSGRASNDVAQVLEAACQGRIDVLFLQGDADLWGRFDPGAGRLQLHPAAEPGDAELLDTAAALTLSRGGAAYALPLGEVPGGGALAAVFRD